MSSEQTQQSDMTHEAPVFPLCGDDTTLAPASPREEDTLSHHDPATAGSTSVVVGQAEASAPPTRKRKKKSTIDTEMVQLIEALCMTLEEVGQQNKQMELLTDLARRSTLAPASRNTLSKGGGIELIIELLRSTDTAVQAHAAAAIANLTMGFEDYALRSCVADKGGLKPLVALLQTKDDVWVQASAAMALRALLRDDFANRREVIELGAVLPLVKLIAKTKNTCVMRYSLRVLRALAFDDDSCDLLVSTGAVSPLISLLSHRSNDIRTFSACTLEELLLNSRPRIKDTQEHALTLLRQSHDQPCQDLASKISFIVSQ